MNKLKIRYSKKSLKFLAKQEKSTVIRIRNAVEKLTYTPPEGDIKELKGLIKQSNNKYYKCI